MRHLLICFLVATAVLFATTGTSAAQDRQTTLGVFEAIVIVKNRPVHVDAVFQKTGSPRSEFDAFADVMHMAGVLAQVAIELDRIQRETAGMTCRRTDTGEKVPCFPRTPVMTAGSLR